MSTIPTNPAEAASTSPQQVPRITVLIHDFAQEPACSSTPRLVPTPAQLRKLSEPARHGRGRHQLADRPWFDLAERVLYSWPITLRVVVLLVVLFTGTAALAAALGVGGQLLLAALGLRTRLHTRRRTTALHRRRAALEAPGE